jgi:hypothetical protein
MFFKYLIRAKGEVSLEMWYAQLLPFPKILGHIAVEEQEEKGDEQEDLHQHSLQIGVSVLQLSEKYSPGGYKEMSSILADQ